MTTANKSIETPLNENDVARMTGMSVATVRRWRLFRQGPKYRKIGSAVRYWSKDVEDWLGSRPTGGDKKNSAAKPTGRNKKRSPLLRKR